MAAALFGLQRVPITAAPKVWPQAAAGFLFFSSPSDGEKIGRSSHWRQRPSAGGALHFHVHPPHAGGDILFVFRTETLTCGHGVAAEGEYVFLLRRRRSCYAIGLKYY